MTTNMNIIHPVLTWSHDHTISWQDDKLYRTSKDYLKNRLPSVGWAKQLYISAKTGLRTADIFRAVDDAAEQHARRVTTSVMNEV